MELGTSVITSGHDPFSLRFNFIDYPGSHVIYTLQQTRRYKVISVDNYHNSFPASLTRVAQIARDTLPENPSEADKESTEIDVIQCDLTSPEQIKGIFERYDKGGIWGVVHIAVSIGFFMQVELFRMKIFRRTKRSASLLKFP